MRTPETFPDEPQAKQPGKEHTLDTQPVIIRESYKGSNKLEGKIAFITGGDSGIGKSAAIHFAREGASVAFVYYNEDKDAENTRKEIENEGVQCLAIKGDIKDENFCKEAIKKTVDTFGSLNIVVNNAAMQFPEDSIEDISTENFHTTFETNIYSFFYVTKAAIKHLKEGDCIINSTSVTAFKGSSHLLDYSSTKGAITAFTRSLSQSLAKKGIRVNGVAPGPIWTPLIPSSFEDFSDFGQDTPLGRAGQPAELGPAYVYLASEDSSYMTGQILHINGGHIVGS